MLMLSKSNDACDIIFTKMENFPDLSFDSVFSTESDDFRFDIINSPIYFTNSNNDLNKPFLHKQENILFEKEMNKDDNKNNLESLYDLEDDNNNGFIILY